ncbi:response regulator [Clostridium sp.]|uniref:response regulator n=1 Tax=Clostridium sp. TaxID=1506 RepID=UPI002FCCB7D7
MIRIMIVDDEKIVIDALSFIIKNNFDDIQVVATARSGREAIETVENVVPDLIFMDIRMPGINGIEAIREIKSRYKDIVYIVLTAFEQFEFAKEAVNLGVLEYLLKPVNKLKVIEVIKRAAEIIEAQRKKRAKELGMKEKLENLIPVLENGFIYSITSLEDNKKDILNYLSLLEIPTHGGYVLTLEFSKEENYRNIQSTPEFTSENQSIHTFIKDTAHSINRCVVGPVMLNRVVIFVPNQCNSEKLSKEEEATSFANTLLSKLSRKSNYKFKIGIGSVCNNVEHLHSSYESSLQALRYLKSSGIIHYNNIKTIDAEYTAYPYDKEKLLLQKLSLGESEESIEAFRYIYRWLSKEYEGQPIKIKNKLLELMFLVNSRLWEYDISSKANEVGLFEEMLLIQEMEELKLWCKKTIENISTEINYHRHNKIGEIIKAAKEYIEANYYKAITLEDISREVNVSSQYFSRLFKAEMKENFIDYLTSIRIEKAKNLLASGTFTIKEICYKIGYSDPNYFSRIFKKRVGISPTEYKN